MAAVRSRPRVNDPEDPAHRASPGDLVEFDSRLAAGYREGRAPFVMDDATRPTRHGVVFDEGDRSCSQRLPRPCGAPVLLRSLLVHSFSR